MMPDGEGDDVSAGSFGGDSGSLGIHSSAVTTRAPFPRLLVSVRDAAECAAARLGGAEIIDVKEPRHGSLGMAPIATIVELAETVHDALLSAALGETADWMAAADVPALPAGLQFVKLGLAGLGNDADWVEKWHGVRRRLEHAAGSALHWVAVVYADWRAATAPEPAQVIAAAAESGCAGVLFDTARKTGGTLLDCLPMHELLPLAARIRAAGMLLALAGSLRAELLPKLAPLEPDIIAVRGAACVAGERGGVVTAERVAAVRRALRRERYPACNCSSRLSTSRYS